MKQMKKLPMLLFLVGVFCITGAVWTKCVNRVVAEETYYSEKLYPQSALINSEEISDTEEKLPQSIQLDVEEMIQTPELPTGCESVALTMALRFLGYEIDKTTIADNYLVYDAENFAKGYMGDPYSANGAGIFPPGLVTTANKFLDEQKSEMSAYDISGAAFEELFEYLAAGNPVLIWTTMYYEEPVFLEIYSEYDGKEYQWYANEHCVLLGGYNLAEEKVTVFDPLQGKLEMSIQTMESLYEKTGKNAITIY